MYVDEGAGTMIGECVSETTAGPRDDLTTNTSSTKMLREEVDVAIIGRHMAYRHTHNVSARVCRVTLRYSAARSVCVSLFCTKTIDFDYSRQ